MAARPKPNAGISGTERIPPQDLDAEMAVLGAMMMGREAISDVVAVINREESSWFYIPAHQRLFELLLDLFEDSTKAIDLIIVADELRRRDLLDFVGGYDYMVQLAESFGEWSNAEHYAGIVRDKGMLRDLIRAAGKISDQCYLEEEKTRTLLDRAERLIFEVTERRVSGQASVIRDLFRRLTDRLSQGGDALCTGLPTGFAKLDEMTSGFQPGDLVIVAGRPSMGKTALGLNMARTAAIDEGKASVFFSMEMSAEQVSQRLVCMQARYDAQKLRRLRVSEDELAQLMHSCASFHDAPLFIDDTPGMSALELRAKARRLKARFDIQAVYVDYLQLMHMPDSESRQAEIATISRGLKSLARELKIPVIAMAQLNRNPEGRHDKRPMMSDLRESGAIEQDADLVLLLHREEYYKPDDSAMHGIAELNIAKQRNGPVGTIRLAFDKMVGRFDSLFEGDEPAFVPRMTSETPF